LTFLRENKSDIKIFLIVLIAFFILNKTKTEFSASQEAAKISKINKIAIRLARAANESAL